MPHLIQNLNTVDEAIGIAKQRFENKLIRDFEVEQNEKCPKNKKTEELLAHLEKVALDELVYSEMAWNDHCHIFDAIWKRKGLKENETLFTIGRYTNKRKEYEDRYKEERKDDKRGEYRGYRNYGRSSYKR